MRAAKIEFTDDAILNEPYVTGREKVIKDPLLRGHRVTVKRRTKAFEIQCERPKRFGSRKTYVLVTGTAPFTKIAEARQKAIEFVSAIRQGKDPIIAAEVATVGSTWEHFKSRPKMRPRTLRGYESLYMRCLIPLADMPLKTLSAQPGIAERLHKQLTENGPIDANRAMQLLRAIYRFAARRDRSLDKNQHPCTSIEFNSEKAAAEVKFIEPSEFPAWANQLDRLRQIQPWRASFQMLNLRLGCRPNELAIAKWEHIDLDDYVLVMPESKTGLYEIPLCPQIVAEFERLRKIIKALYPGSEYICPPTFAQAKHPRYVEEKAVLAFSGSAGRTTHHSIGAALKIDDRVLDLMEGRTLKKSGATSAGRHYLAINALGPLAKAAQLIINDEIDRLLACKSKTEARHAA